MDLAKTVLLWTALSTIFVAFAVECCNPDYDSERCNGSIIQSCEWCGGLCEWCWLNVKDCDDLDGWYYTNGKWCWRNYYCTCDPYCGAPYADAYCDYTTVCCDACDYIGQEKTYWYGNCLYHTECGECDADPCYDWCNDYIICCNECTEGSVRCNGNLVQECRTDGDDDPCTEWVTIKNCDSYDGWYNYGDAGPGCAQTNDPTAEYRDYYCDSGTCKYTVTQTKDCDSYDGWYGGGNTSGCGNDPACQYRDYYVNSSGPCSYTTTNCPTKDCDSGDICSYTCNGSKVVAYKDCYCSSGSCVCYYGPEIEDCATKPSTDTDSGDDPFTQGTVTDYTTCSNGSCQYNKYTDYCSGSTLTEYIPSGSSYTTKTYNCDSYDSVSYDTTTDVCSWENWACGSGRCYKASSGSYDCDDYDQKTNGSQYVVDYEVSSTSCTIGCTGTGCCYKAAEGYCNDTTHTNCQSITIEGTTLYCTYDGSTWAWRTSYPAEVCGDGVDNDCDGLTDSADPDCDSTPPTTTITPNGASCSNTDVSFTLSCSDSGTGCATTYYAIIDASATCPAPGDPSYVVGTSGTVSCAAGSACSKAVCYYSVDNAGNVESPSKSNAFNIDKASPAVPTPASPLDTTVKSPVTLSWSSVSDIGCAGSVEYYAEIYPTSDCSGTPSASSGWITDTSWSVELSVGAYSWRVKSKDSLGNESAWSDCASFNVCEDECPYEGAEERICNKNTPCVRTCGNYDEDPCLEWSPWACTQDCDLLDGNYCNGSVVETRDYYCSNGNCEYTVTSTVDCSLVPSTDSDGDDPFTRGTVRDYTTCSNGTCAYVDYTDYCQDASTLVEYLASGDSYTTKTYNCDLYDGWYGNEYRDYSCSDGACTYVVTQTDTSPPNTTITPDGSSCSGTDVNFALSCTDDASGCAHTYYSFVSAGETCPPVGDSSYVEGTEGTVQCGDGEACEIVVCYYSVDNLGNVETVKASSPFYIDKASPEAPSPIAPTGTVTTETVSFSWTAVSDVGCANSVEYNVTIYSGSGCSGSVVSSSGWISESSWSTTLSDGVYSWNVAAKDAFGNTSLSGCTDFNVVLDSTPPTTTITPDGTPCTGTDVNFYLSCSDDSGCAATYYVIIPSDQNCPSQGDPAYVQGTEGTVSCPQNSVCSLVVCFYSEDTYGNVENVKRSSEFVIDKVPPSIPTNLSPSETYTNTVSTLSWSASSDAGCGVSYYHVVVEGVLDKNTSSTSLMFTPSSDGNYVWSVEAVDAAGNVSEKAFTWFVYDATPPTITLIEPANNAVLEDVSEAKLVFELSEDSNYSIYLDGTLVGAGFGTGTRSMTVSVSPGTHTWKVEATDTAGNTGHSQENSFTVLVADPAITDTNLPDYARIGTVDIAVKVSNLGTLDCNAKIYFFVDGVLTDSTHIQLDPGVDKEVIFSWSASQGNHTIRFEISPVDRNIDADLQNSYYQKSIYVGFGPNITPTNLTVIAPEAHPRPKETYSVQVTVVNVGDLPAGSFFVSLYDDTGLVEEKEVSGLDPSASKVVNFEWTVPHASVIPLTVVVDSTNTILETDENDNTLSIGVTVYPTVYNDVDDDNVLEAAVDYDSNVPGYETFDDPGGTVSVLLAYADMEGDTLVDLFVDYDGNLLCPEVLWDPDENLLYTPICEDTDGDQNLEWCVGAVCYDPDENTVWRITGKILAAAIPALPAEAAAIVMIAIAGAILLLLGR